MSRIQSTFASQRKVLISYCVAMEHGFDKTLEILNTLAQYSDIIEIGIPFSNAVADGVVIQAASLKSLSNYNTSTADVIRLVEEFRKINQSTPIILMGYYNSIFSFGNEAFLKQAKHCGADGIIICDLPMEECNEFYSLSKQYSIDLIQLISSVTPPDRIREIKKFSSGFVYYVGILGVTGTQNTNPQAIKDGVLVTREIFSSDERIPLVVGFGINSPSQAHEICKFSDGIVIGSHFVKAYNNCNGNIATFAKELDLFHDAVKT